jgi:tRNA threonylcarbamoyladenosine biosynthesis protein TsaB
VDKPLYGVCSLDALARVAAIEDGFVCPMLDARMGEVYGAVYHYNAGQRETMLPPMAAQVEDVIAMLEGPVHVLGDGATRYRPRIEAILPEASFAAEWRALPRASAVAAEALAVRDAGASGDADAVIPVYLRQAKVDLRGMAAPGSPGQSAP